MQPKPLNAKTSRLLDLWAVELDDYLSGQHRSSIIKRRWKAAGEWTNDIFLMHGLFIVERVCSTSSVAGALKKRIRIVTRIPAEFSP